MTGWKISYFHFIYFVLALLNDIPIKMARVDKVSLQLLATALRTTQQQTPTKTTDDYQLPKFHGITKAKTLVNTSVCLLVWCSYYSTQLQYAVTCATTTIYCIYRSQDVIKL